MTLVTIVGCGSDAPKAFVCDADKGPGPDPSRVRLTVYQYASATSCIPVWFNDSATGDLIVEGMTDATGAFSAVVPADATVTSAAMEPDKVPASWQLYTVFRTKPGDDIWVGGRQKSSSAALGTLTVTLPGPVAGAMGYDVSIGCKVEPRPDTSMPVDVQVFANCLTADSRLAVVARAFDPMQIPIAFVAAVGVMAPADGGTVMTTLGPWQTDFAKFSMTLKNVPPAVTVATTELAMFRDGVRFELGSANTAMPTAGATLTYPFQLASGFATRLLWSSTVSYGTSRLADGVQILVGSASPSTGDAFDATTEPLPLITAGVGIIGENGSPLLSWKASADLSMADGVVGRAQWSNPDGSKVRWTVFAPAGTATTLAFPRIPTSLAKVRGVNGILVVPTIQVIDADHLHGYDEFRRGGGQQVVDDRIPTSDFRVRITAAGVPTL